MPAERRGAGGAGVLSPENIRRLTVPTVLLVVVGLFGAFGPGTWPFVATFGVVQALLALSVGMLFGRTGMLSLCPLGFAAISVWVVLWFNTNARLPFLIMVLLGALAAIPAGVLVGGLAVRLRGVNLAIVTLAFGTAIVALFSRHNFPGILDNPDEIPDVRPAGFDSHRVYFVLGFVIMVATGIALEWLGRRRPGQAWRAVRSSERATAAAGLSVPGVKLSAFVVSAFIAGLGGGIYAGQLEGSVDVRSFGALLSLGIVAAALLLGAQSLSGAVIAGFLGALIPEFMRRRGWAVEYPQILFGIGAIHALSQGGGGISATFPWRKPRQSRREAPTAPEPLAGGVAEVDGSPLLEIDGVTVRFGALAALDGVDFSVPPGQVVGVIGPNGAGKSTLVDAVCGFVDYDGRISLRGRSIDAKTATARARAGVRRTFQQGRAIEELTVGEFVNLYCSSAPSPDELDALLGFFGLPPADQPIVFIDVGTRRILEVAAAVASRPAVAFLDEPTAGLGAEEAAALGERIREIPDRFGCSIVLIEHNVELVANLCSHITVLDFGVVLARGTPEEVLADSRVAAAYLGEEIEPVGQPVAGGGGQ
jgi:branched-chain amino acid transport system permease protein